MPRYLPASISDCDGGPRDLFVPRAGGPAVLLFKLPIRRGAAESKLRVSPGLTTKLESPALPTRIRRRWRAWLRPGYYQFDGQLCELSCEQFADAGFVEELSFDELPATVREHLDATAVRLEKVRAAAADLTRGFTTQCRFFWCANHRPGCDWRTIEQIQHRRGADAWNGAMDDSVVPIESWNDQIAAAMLDLNQLVEHPINKLTLVQFWNGH